MSDPALPGYGGTRGMNVWEADAGLRAAAGPRLSAKGREMRDGELAASAYLLLTAVRP